MVRPSKKLKKKLKRSEARGQIAEVRNLE